MKILSSQAMQSLDHNFIETYRVSQDILMENAALGSFYYLRSRGLHMKKTLIFCGPGNNGGDGLALARKLFSVNKDVTVYLACSPEGYEGASKRNFASLSLMDIPVIGITSPEDILDIPSLTEDCLIVDALLGTGLKEDLRGIIGKVVDYINTSKAFVLSLDIPTGLSSDSGLALGRAVASSATLSFGSPKYGHFIGEGRRYVPRLVSCNISIGEELVDSEVTLPLLRPLKPRSPLGYKGSYGRALFISGCSLYLGAPYFNTAAFIASGGGYAYLASTPDTLRSVATSIREAVLIPCPATPGGSISSEALEELLERALQCDIAAIGSGLSLDQSTGDLITSFITGYDGSLIVDGDGLSVLSGKPSLLSERRGDTILTPHIGEFAKLTGMSVEEIRKDPIGILRDFSTKNSCYTVLKDATSLTASPDGRVVINTSGNSGMAVAGSGDVLVGILAASLCNFFEDTLEAVSFGVFLHGLTGDLVRDRFTPEGVTPTRMIDFLPEAIRIYREEHHSLISRYIPEIY